MPEPRLTIISRADAELGPVTVGYPIPHEQVRRIVVHHDVIQFDPNAADIVAAAKAHSRALYRSRLDLGGDWPYSWGVAPDYRDEDHTIIVEGRGWRRTGAHTAGMNSTAYGVVLFGNYMDMRVTRGQVYGIRLLGRWLARPEEALPTLYHQQVKAGTQCPGDNAKPVISWLTQPPFIHDDIARFYPEVSVPTEVVPDHNPPFTIPNIVSTLNAPGGGAWLLTEDGAVYTAGSALYFGGTNTPNWDQHWKQHGAKARRLHSFRDAKGRDRYLIEDQHGHLYGHDGF